ncbi:MAG: GAF domain-containing protein [Candidatus Eremiobacterota bacterium]
MEDELYRTALDILVSRKLVDPKAGRKLEKAAEQQGRSVLELLLQEGKLDRPTLLRSLAEATGVPACDVLAQPASPAVALLVPVSVCRELKVLPVVREGDRLVVAMQNPSNVFGLHRVMMLTGHECVPRVAFGPDLEAAITLTFPPGSERGHTPADESKQESRFVVATRATRYEGDFNLRMQMVKPMEDRKVRMDGFVTLRAVPMGTPASVEEAGHMLEQNLLHLLEPSHGGSQLRDLLGLADRLCGSEGASLMLLTEDRQELAFVEATGPRAAQLRGMRLPLDETSIAGYSLLHRQTLRVDDAEHDPRQSKRTDESIGFQTRSLVSCPLFFDGAPLGVLQVVNKREGSFSVRDVEMLQVLGAQAAIAVHLGRLRQYEATVEWKMVNGLRTMLGQADLGARVSDVAIDLGRALLLPTRELERLKMAGLLVGMEPETGSFTLLQMGLRSLIPLIRHGREHFDGTGGPDRLAGEAIPHLARVLAVAREWAQVRPRCRDDAEAMHEVGRHFGTRLDPSLREPLERALGRQEAALMA